MSSSKRKTSATGFAVLGAVCLLGLTFEYSLIMFEQFLYNKLYNKFTITESITHWLIISGLWSILGLVLFYISARVYGYNFIKKNYVELFLLRSLYFRASFYKVPHN